MASSLSMEAGVKAELPVTATDGKAIQLLQRAQWLRAAILGANDGLLSTASLMLGTGAATDNQETMIVSGVAGAVAGACSMAAGEFVSVSTQRDIEKLLIRKCSSDAELCRVFDDANNIKLQISASAHPTLVESGMPEANSATDAVLATPCRTPLVKLMACDCELSQGKISPAIEHIDPSPCVVSPSRSALMKGIVSDQVRSTILQDDSNKKALPNPYKAAVASGLAFLFGPFVPIVPAMMVVSNRSRVVTIMVATSVALALFGGLGALIGGSSTRKSAMRVLLGCWLSVAITYGLLKALDRDDKVHES